MSCLVYQNVIGPNPCGGSGTPGWVAVSLFIWNNGNNMTVETSRSRKALPRARACSSASTTTSPGTRSASTSHSTPAVPHRQLTRSPWTRMARCSTTPPHWWTTARAPSLLARLRPRLRLRTAPPARRSLAQRPDTDIRITQFFRGAFTTANGQRGTFAGSWTLNLVIITSQGDPPPGNQLQVEPAFLWNDGMGNGWGDAFGVWWRPTPDSASRGTTHKDCSGRVTGPSSLGRRCITHTQVAEQIQAVCQLASRGAGHWVIPADRRRRWSARSPRAARQQWTRGL